MLHADKIYTLPHTWDKITSHIWIQIKISEEIKIF